MGDAVPVTIVPPVPGVAAVPGVKPAAPYSTIKLLPVEVKLTDADVDVTDPIETAEGVVHDCPLAIATDMKTVITARQTFLIREC